MPNYDKKLIPHRGWSCINPEGLDTGELSHQCEMCGTHIRYLYRMTHPEYSGILTVGSECTLNISVDYQDIQQRRLARTRRQNKLRNFMNKGWSQATGVTIEMQVREYKSHQVYIYQRFGNWRFQIEYKIYPWCFNSADAAKQGAFNYLEKF